MIIDKLCCYFSEFAYKSDNEVMEMFSNCNDNNYAFLQGFDISRFYSSAKDAQCFVTNKENTIYIVFNGTESIRDWLTDANIIRVPMDLPGISNSDRPRNPLGIFKTIRSVQHH